MRGRGKASCLLQGCGSSSGSFSLLVAGGKQILGAETRRLSERQEGISCIFRCKGHPCRLTELLNHVSEGPSCSRRTCHREEHRQAG